MKKIISLLLILCMAGSIFFTAPQTEAAAIKLNTTKKTLYVGSSYKLKVKGTSQKITWKSSKKSVAKVSKKGVVKSDCCKRSYNFLNGYKSKMNLLHSNFLNVCYKI